MILARNYWKWTASRRNCNRVMLSTLSHLDVLCARVMLVCGFALRLQLTTMEFMAREHPAPKRFCQQVVTCFGWIGSISSIVRPWNWFVNQPVWPMDLTL